MHCRVFDWFGSGRRLSEFGKLREKAMESGFIRDSAQCRSIDAFDAADAAQTSIVVE